MKSIKQLALVTGLLALSGVSQAQFTSTWTAVSDYDFRGFSQSAKGPALQGSADYAFGESGFAVGAWASNVDFNDPDEGWVSDADIERYVERERPFDCAGGFKAEALGITLFERMDSQDPTAIIGLPLIWLAGALRSAGFALP